MANIISPICFSNANNDSANNGSDFKVSVFEDSAWVCGCFFKAQEIDVPLASTGRLATESELHMFSQKMLLRCAELLSLYQFRFCSVGFFDSSLIVVDFGLFTFFCWVLCCGLDLILGGNN